MKRQPSSRGSTLVELIVVLAISSIVVVLVVAAMMDLDRGRRPRELAAEVQGEGRFGLSLLEREVRAASLGASSGVVWADRSSARVARPMVQIYDDLPGGGGLGAKEGTDAILVVRAETGAWAATVGDHRESTADVAVTAPALFAPGDSLLLGEYGDASWDEVSEVRTGALDLVSAVNVFPGRQSTVLHAGAFVRRARATLFFVSRDDRLMRATLKKPWAPRSGDELLEVTQLAQGVENLQVTCETEVAVGTGLVFGGCPAEAGNSGDLATEVAWAFGAFKGSDGPRFTAETIGSLRSVTMDVAFRSRNPMPDGTHGDPKVTLDGRQLEVGGKPDDAEYMRRTYRVGVGIRNTSLEVL